ncbi:hypothetical protein Sfulv_03340 [Streptomyces fulvorobeus]|uniref:Uncharacterized protein n=1 Tax=Streptomyces fulvorobeus TaxID=284028 RepID=A0A7J0C0P9_9ACTN|nr:hypothetical protein Sfulv_03340 [Streptomyces fulvorobeus]
MRRSVAREKGRRSFCAVIALCSDDQAVISMLMSGFSGRCRATRATRRPVRPPGVTERTLRPEPNLRSTVPGSPSGKRQATRRPRRLLGGPDHVRWRPWGPVEGGAVHPEVPGNVRMAS